jgi:hypothetical protein
VGRFAALAAGFGVLLAASSASAFPAAAALALTGRLFAAFRVSAAVRGFTALTADLGHMLAVLAHRLAAFAGDLALLLVIHCREAALFLVSH